MSIGSLISVVLIATIIDVVKQRCKLTTAVGEMPREICCQIDELIREECRYA